MRLSNGHELEYVTASGALGFFGEGWPWDKPFIFAKRLDFLPFIKEFNIDPSLFTIVAKTVTFKKRKGNLRRCWPFGCIRFIKDGTLNAVGLTNPGFPWWNKKARKKREGISLMASIFSEAEDAPDELAYMAEVLDSTDRIVGIEINASCPNTEGDVLENVRKIIESCEKVKRATSHPLILKLSVVHNIDEILPHIKGIIEAISINSVPWRIVFPYKRSPLKHLGGGGVSGKAAQQFTWPFVEELVSKTDIPVIAPSIWEYEDIEKVRARGAKAISFGSIFLRYPWRPSKFVRRDKGAS